MGFGGSSGISWTICKQSAPRSRQITTPTPHHSMFTGQMLFLMPTNSVKALTHGLCSNMLENNQQVATVTAARSHMATRCHLLITLSILTAGMIKYVPTKMPLPTVESQSSNSRSLSPTKSTYKWHFHQFSHFAVLANVSNIGRNSLHLTLHTRCGLTTHTSAILQTDLGYLLSRFSFTTNSLS